MFPGNKFESVVPPLTTDDVDVILDSWLTSAKRTLTSSQREHLLETIRNKPIPLLLKLSFDEAVTWRSYFAEEQTQLQTSVLGMISALFDRLERVHGKVLVSHALGYLTAGNVIMHSCSASYNIHVLSRHFNVLTRHFNVLTRRFNVLFRPGGTFRLRTRRSVVSFRRSPQRRLPILDTTPAPPPPAPLGQNQERNRRICRVQVRVTSF